MGTTPHKLSLWDPVDKRQCKNVCDKWNTGDSHESLRQWNRGHSMSSLSRCLHKYANEIKVITNDKARTEALNHIYIHAPQTEGHSEDAGIKCHESLRGVI